MTDQEIDSLIDQHRPHLREAYRNIFEKQHPYVALKVASMKLPTGAEWDVVLYMATEPIANLIHGSLSGYMALNQSLQKGVVAPKTPGPGKTAGAFGLPSL